MDLILTAAAAAPAIVLMAYIYRKDGIEHEPIRLLLALFLGGCVSVVPVMVCELFADSLLLSMFGDSVIYIFMENFFGVALMEEGWKLIFLIAIAWKSKHFGYLFDGIVYAVFVSLGFALVENILYVTGEGSLGDGLALAGSRALLSVPLHCFCGVFMGFFFGQAKDAKINGDKSAYKHAKVMAITVPVAIHGFYDFCLSMDSELLIIVFFIFVVAMYVYAFKRVAASAKEDRAFRAAVPAESPVEAWPPQSMMNQYVAPAPQATASRTNWYCPNCGSSNSTSYCPNCGTPRPIMPH